MNRLIKNSLTRLLNSGSTSNPTHPNLSKQHQHKWWCYHQYSSSTKSDDNFEAVEKQWKPMEGVVRCSANHIPLTPISFLERSARVFGDRASIVYGEVKYTWGETHLRCTMLASALSTHLGISQGDVVSLFSVVK